MTNCIKCGKYPVFKHPETGKELKLCAICGLEALEQLLGMVLPPTSALVKSGYIAIKGEPCEPLPSIVL